MRSGEVSGSGNVASCFHAGGLGRNTDGLKPEYRWARPEYKEGWAPRVKIDLASSWIRQLTDNGLPDRGIAAESSVSD